MTETARTTRSQALTATPPAVAGSESGALLEQVVAGGDLAGLSAVQRSAYYGEVCRSVGLNPLTRPFEYLTLNNRLVLYARKDATDQLRSLHHVSLQIVSRETIGDLYVVTARATMPDGRTDEEIGAVSIGALRGDALCNALMRASTKSKRRVTLSICGLGWLDESELETIPAARRARVDPSTGEIRERPEAAEQSLPAQPVATAEESRLARAREYYATLCRQAIDAGIEYTPLDALAAVGVEALDVIALAGRELRDRLRAAEAARAGQRG